MKLSIVIPVYNSSIILNDLVREINFALTNKYSGSFELILVNDCSLDDSWNVIENLSKKFKFIKGIDLKNNIGQHAAIFVGLKYAKGNLIITMDDDLQHPPKSIVNICKKLINNDACYTVYINRKHSLWKILVSKTNNV